MLNQIALVSETTDLDNGELTDVAAALQKQVSRDFGPLWNIEATVDAVPRLENVEVGYWRVIVAKSLPNRRIGFHRDRDGQPFAMVVLREDWPRLASHEVLEMLADPFGNRFIAGPSIKTGQGRVEYLVEVCDPCGDEEFGYSVNGRWLSDFYTLSYFDPIAVPGGRYSFTGRLPGPRQILPGGYLSWKVPETQEWWQARHDGTEISFEKLQRPPDGACLRAAIDRQSPPTRARPAGSVTRQRNRIRKTLEQS